MALKKSDLGKAFLYTAIVYLAMSVGYVAVVSASGLLLVAIGFLKLSSDFYTGFMFLLGLLTIFIIVSYKSYVLIKKILKFIVRILRKTKRERLIAKKFKFKTFLIPTRCVNCAGWTAKVCWTPGHKYYAWCRDCIVKAEKKNAR